MKINLTVLLQIAGVLHLGLMCAGLLMPRVVGMRGHLAALPPFIRPIRHEKFSSASDCRPALHRLHRQFLAAHSISTHSERQSRHSSREVCLGNSAVCLFSSPARK